MTIKNGVVTITSEVLADVLKEAEEIIQTAENEAKQTLNAAKHEADKTFLEKVNEAQSKADVEKRKIASLTEVETRNRILHTKEELVDAAFQSAIAKLRDFTDTQQYRDFLVRTIQSLATKIGAKTLIIEVNTRDKTWLNQNTLNSISKKLDLELKLSDKTGTFIGGVKFSTEDNKVSYDGTIDNRLDQLKPVLRVEAAKILFEKEGQANAR